jgi:hypothetical protein
VEGRPEGEEFAETLSEKLEKIESSSVDTKVIPHVLQNFGDRLMAKFLG